MLDEYSVSRAHVWSSDFLRYSRPFHLFYQLAKNVASGDMRDHGILEHSVSKTASRTNGSLQL